MKSKVVGIIGGTGGMGRFFERVFLNHGHKVLIASRTTSLSIEELVDSSDIVFLSTPVEAALDIVKRIGPQMRSEQLLADFCSQKEAIVNEMVEHTICDVVGTHPMFGHFTESLNGQNVILCNGRGAWGMQWLRDEFGADGATLTELSHRQHDQFMALIQSLTHLITIALGKTMQEMNLSPDDALSIATPIFRLKMDFIGRLLALDLPLYNSLVGHNPHMPEVLSIFQSALSDGFSSMSSQNNTDGLDYLEGIRDYFGEFSTGALTETNRLLDFLYSKDKG